MTTQIIFSKTNTLVSRCIMHLYTHISNIVVKYGMYLVKPNLNACTNYRAARIIKNLGNNVDHTFALHEQGWGPLKDDRRKVKAKMMYKVLNKMGPTSLGNLFTYKDEVTCYNLQDVSSSLYLPKPRTNSMKKKEFHV